MINNKLLLCYIAILVNLTYLIKSLIMFLNLILFRSEIEIIPTNITACSSTIDQCTPAISQSSLSSRKIVGLFYFIIMRCRTLFNLQIYNGTIHIYIYI